MSLFVAEELEKALDELAGQKAENKRLLGIIKELKKHECKREECKLRYYYK